MSQPIRPEDLQPGRTALVTMFPLHIGEIAPAPAPLPMSETSSEPTRVEAVKSRAG